MKLKIFNTRGDLVEWVVSQLLQDINSLKLLKKDIVLGLPTGSTYIPIYKNLINKYKDGKLSFQNIITFNMDEYLGIEPTHEASFSYFMHKNLFDNVDIKKENINILSSFNTTKSISEICLDYSEKIKHLGGIDIQLAGVGVDGHIAFNEPFSTFNSTVRMVRLNELTINYNKKIFEDMGEKMPDHALTIGIKEILDSRKLIVVGFGREKARVIANAIEGPMRHSCPLSCIQMHSNITVCCDIDAASLLNYSTLEYYQQLV